MTSTSSLHSFVPSAPATTGRSPIRRLALAALAFSLLIPVAQAAADAPAVTGFWDSLAKGKFSGVARYRYEIYQQDSVPGATTAAAGKITDDGIASTLRFVLGYETAVYEGFNAYVDVEGIYAVGEEENYRIPNHPTQGAATRAIIADPLTTGVNQAYVKWKLPETGIQLLAGRENYFLNNGRLISFSGWRQNNQSIDLARVSTKIDAFTANYGYLARVHRVIGPDPSDGTLRMNSHVGSLDFAKPGVANASLYALLLDYDPANQSGNDTKTVGLRLTGPHKLSANRSLIYTADYARQTDYADNALSISLDYWTLELGLAFTAQKIFAGWTVLEGGSGATFRTPLAHPFNGWTEKFLNTPANGLDALYVTATGPVPNVKGLTYTATFYDYHATTGRAHYGSELDAALEWKAEPIHKNLTVGWRFGKYFADALLTDSLRTSVYGTFKF